MNKYAFVRVIVSHAPWLRNNIFYCPVTYEQPWVDRNGHPNGGLHSLLETQEMDCCWGFDKLEDAQRHCVDFNNPVDDDCYDCNCPAPDSGREDFHADG